ncbi:hypothetical protein Tco_1070736 [Tanacetum coccineum]|uniref:Uncharacterized protein n=1 Tax=Tanacetum coccineum TaxID=301880 RepID=A0ABQ5HMJ7_9ASTR
METNKPLIKDEEAENVDLVNVKLTPRFSHLHAMKRIFRYLKGQPKLGLWYPRDSPFDLEAFSDSDYAGASLDRKSTTGGCQFLGKRLISWQYSNEKKLIQVIKIHTDQNVADLLTKAFDVSRKVGDEAVYKELGDRMEMVDTTASSSEAEQDSARRVKSSNAGLGAQEDASKQGRSIEDIDEDDVVTLVNETQEQQNEDLIFDTGVLDDD